MLMLRSPIRQSHDPACLRVSRSLGPLHRLGRVPPAICSQGQVTTDICRGCRVSRPTRKPTRHADAATARWVQWEQVGGGFAQKRVVLLLLLQQRLLFG